MWPVALVVGAGFAAVVIRSGAWILDRWIAQRLHCELCGGRPSVQLDDGSHEGLLACWACASLHSDLRVISWDQEEEGAPSVSGGV